MMITVTQTRREITVRSARLDYVEIDKRVATMPALDTTMPAVPTDTKAPSTKMFASQLAGKETAGAAAAALSAHDSAISPHAGKFDAAGAAVAAASAIGTTVSLGNVSGAVTLSLTPNTTHTATLTGNLTSWTITGLADGQAARVILTTAGYTVATTGLSAYNGLSNALTNIAVSGIVIHVLRVGSTYYAIC